MQITSLFSALIIFFIFVANVGTILAQDKPADPNFGMVGGKASINIENNSNAANQSQASKQTTSSAPKIDTQILDDLENQTRSSVIDGELQPATYQSKAEKSSAKTYEPAYTPVRKTQAKELEPKPVAETKPKAAIEKQIQEGLAQSSQQQGNLPVMTSDDKKPMVAQTAGEMRQKTMSELFNVQKKEEQASGGGGSLIGSGGVMQTLGALGLVVAAIFLLRWFLMKKQKMGGGKGVGLGLFGRTQGPVELMQRTPIGNKTHVLLLRVNHRVMVVSQCGANMTVLCEIDDPEEVAILIGDLSGRQPESQTAAFREYMREADAAYDETQPLAQIGADDSEQYTDRARHTLSGLMNRIKSIKSNAG